MGKGKLKDLVMCDWQFWVRHKSKNLFKIGEIVFLKSNPEVPLIVYSLKTTNYSGRYSGELDEGVICSWKSKDGEQQFYSFPFECILQYKYACFVEYREKYKFCLN